MADPFSCWTQDDLVRLIAENPLAWIVPLADPACAMQMPLVASLTPGTNAVRLSGHLPRRLALVPLLQADPRALFLFQGPNAYITPRRVSQPQWGATWNMVNARLGGHVRFDADSTEDGLRALADHMERGQDQPWQIEHLGERLDLLKQHIIGFEARVDDTEMRMKLGQDETAGAFAEIVSHLDDHPLADWMRQARQVEIAGTQEQDRAG